MLIDEKKICERIDLVTLNKINNKLIKKLEVIEDKDFFVYLNLFREDYNFEAQKKLYLIEYLYDVLEKNKMVTVHVKEESTFLILKYIFQNNKNLILNKGYKQKILNRNIISSYFYILYFFFKKIIFLGFNKFNFAKGNNYIITNSNLDMSNDTKFNKLPEIIREIKTEENKEVIHCPNITNFKILNIIKFFKSENILIKEHYYSFVEILKVFFKFKKIMSLEKKKLKLYDDIIHIIYFVLKYEKSNYLFFESYLNYYCFKRISSKNNNINYFISWWENQITSKLIFKSMEHNKKITKLAYLGYPTRNIDLRLVFNQIDLSNNFLPDHIYFISDYFRDKYSKYSKYCKLKIVTSERYLYLKNYNQLSKEFILVSLPIFVDESTKIIDLLLNLIENNKSNLSKIIISLHPGLNLKLISKKLSTLEKYVNFIGINCFKKFLKYSKVLVSSSSGTVLEALVCGIPVAIISKKSTGDFYGIPTQISTHQIFSISNSNQLLDIIRNNDNYTNHNIDTNYLKKMIFNL